MTPKDALIRAIEYAGVSSCDPRRPGLLIQRLPPHIRAALEQLTSDDSLDIRADELLPRASDGSRP